MDQPAASEVPLPVEASVETPSVHAVVEAPKPPKARIWLRVLIILVLCALAGWAVVYGIRLRPRIYVNTTGLHWGDATNAYDYGHAAKDYGLFHLYQVMHTAQEAKATNLPNNVAPAAMDYPPLRLAVVAGWYLWGEKHMPKEQLGFVGDSSYLMFPMLRVNMVCELISSIFVFLLIRMWVVRMDRSSLPPMVKPPWWRGIPSASVGALLLWFNPGLLWNSYAFVQWDTWVITFYLGALLLASVDRWFFAGVLIATGAMLKGQMLLVAPLFVLWPLFQLKWDAAVRWLCGFGFAAAVIGLPWMEPHQNSIIPLVLGINALGLSVPFVLRRKLTYPWWIGLGVSSALLVWPWGSGASITIRLIPIAVVGCIWMLHFAPRRIVPHTYAMAVACLIFLLMPLHGASDYWYQVGFKYGTDKFPSMATNLRSGRPGTHNLPSLLESNFGWTGDPRQANVTLYGDTSISVRNFMLSLYGICLVLSAFGAAMHARRNDPRFLVAVIAPWICSFALLTQMNNRYLVWAAGLSALLPAVGVGMTLLGILVSILAMIGIAQLQYVRFPINVDIVRYLTPLENRLGWMLLLMAAVYLYVAIIPRRRTRTL